MNVTNKFAILLTLFLTLGITTVAAETVSLEPQQVEGDVSQELTFDITNDGSDEVYRIKVEATSSYGDIDTNTISCPTGWEVKSDETDASQVTCLGDADPSSEDNLDQDETGTVTFSATTPTGSEEDFTWDVSSTDNAFNTETNSVSILVDDVAPTTSTDDTGTDWRTSSQTITLDPTDDGSGVATTYYCVDQSDSCDPSSDGSTGTSVTVDSEGTNYVRYYSEDEVGNDESVNSGKVKIDTGAPDTTDDAPSGWQSSDVTVDLTPSDQTSGVANTSYCEDNSQSNDCDPADATTEEGESGASVTVDQEGTTYVRYQSTDTAGNEESIEETTVQVDKTAPSISNVKGDFTTGTGDTETITADVSDDYALDSSTVEIKLDTDNDGNFEETSQMTDTGDGTFEYSYTAPTGDTNQDDYQVVAQDEAGNQQTSSTYTITIDDNDAPTITDNTADSATTGESLEFSADVSDNIQVDTVKAHYKYAGESSYTEISLSGSEKYTDSITVDDTVNNIQYYITATDTSDNTAREPQGDEEYNEVTVNDNDDPTASLTFTTPVDEDTSVTLDASASEDNTGIVEYRWDFTDDGNTDETTTESASTTHNFEDPGTYTVSVTVEDKGGNTDEATKDIKVDDTTSPTVDSISVEESDTLYSNYQTVNLDITASDNDQVDSVVADFANLENQFRFTDTNEDGTQDLTAQWTEYSADEVVQINSGNTQTTDYTKLVVPTDFTLQSDTSLTYEALYTSDSGIEAPDETYLFMEDGTMLATTNNNGAQQCTESANTWCEWSLSATDHTVESAASWYKVNSDGTIKGVKLSNYHNQNVVAVGFAAGTTSSPGDIVDVYLDDFDLPNNGVVSQESDLQSLYEVTASDSDSDSALDVSYTLVNGPDYADKDIQVTATDPAGNEGSSSKTVTLDNKKPGISSAKIEDTSDTNGVVGDSDLVRISAEVTDDSPVDTVTADASAFGAGKVMLTHDTGDTYDATITVNEASAYSDGSYSVTVEATDDASNKETATTGTLTLDTTKPDVTGASISEVNNPDGLVTEGDQVEVSATVTDSNLDTVETDASAFGAGTVTLTPDSGDTYDATFVAGSQSTPTDGTHSLNVDATDLADNLGSDPTGDIEVDIESPANLQVSAPSSTVYKQTDQALDVDYSYNEDNPDQTTIILEDDNGNSVSYSFDDSGYAGDGGTQQETLDLSSPDQTSEEGLVAGKTYDVTLEVLDQAGTSTSSVKETDRVVIDETKPSITLSEVAGGDDYINIDEASGEGQIVGSWSDENPVKELRPFADGDANYAEGGYPDPGSSGSFNYEFDISNWQSGTSVELGVEAEDEAGNVRSKSETVTLDLNRPAAPDDVTAENINIDRQDDYSVEVSLVAGHEKGTVTARLSDGSSSVKATKEVNADDDSGSTVTVDFGDVSNKLSEGGVDVDAKFTDKAGNDNTNGFKEFTTVHKDTIRPEVVEEDSEVTSSNTISVAFTEGLDGTTVSPEDFRVNGFTIDKASEVTEGEVELTLVSDMGTGDAPKVTVEDNDTLEDSYQNSFTGDTMFTPTDTLAPTLSEATTVDSDGDGYIEAVDFKFGEAVKVADTSAFEVSGYSGEKISDDDSDQTVRVEVDKGSSYDTGATPEVTVNAGAVEDTASTPNEFASDTTVTSDDGAAPVLLHSEINNAVSDGSATKVDLTFTEFVDVSGSATAQLKDEPGELRFNSQTGETVQATYWEDGSKAVLETGDAPEVSSFTGVEDVDHYREAGHDFSRYSSPATIDQQDLTQTNVDLRMTYDTSRDEYRFTATGVSNYGSDSGVVFGFDVDDDGQYDFQVDAKSSGYQPDYYEYGSSSGWTTDTYDFNSGSQGGEGTSEYDGVFFKDSGTLLENKNSFTLTVDRSRLGSDFAVNADDQGGSFTKDGDSGRSASDAITVTAGTSEADLVVDGDSDDLNEDYETIQNAIDNAESGDTIVVKSGTYKEEVRVSKEVNLVGKGEPKLVTDSSVAGDNHHPALQLKADGIEVRNMVISRKVTNDQIAGNGHTKAVGVSFDRTGSSPAPASVTLSNIKTVLEDDTGSEDYGNAIWISTFNAYGGQRDTIDVTIEDVTAVNDGVAPDSSGFGGSSLAVLAKEEDVDVDANGIELRSSDERSVYAYEDSASAEVTIDESRLISNKGVVNDGSTSVAATGNWFGMDGIQTTGSVDASYINLNTASNSLNADVDTFSRILNPGANKVSFPINQGTVDAGSVTDGLEDLEAAWTYQNGEWKEVATGDSDEFRGGLGYIFNMDGQETLSMNVDHEFQTEISGNQPSSPVSYNATSGWNLLGSLEEYDESTGDAMSSLENAAGDKKYEVQKNPSEIETGHAYWTLMKEDGVYANAE